MGIVALVAGGGIALGGLLTVVSLTGLRLSFADADGRNAGREGTGDIDIDRPGVAAQRHATLTGGRIPWKAILPSVVAAGVVGAATRWPVAALLGGLAGYYVPRIFGTSSAVEVTAKAEAVASWAEMLRDSLVAASGLEQAVTVSAPIAPPVIRAEVQSLSARVESGMPLGSALRAFADEIDEPGADLVVSALVLASEQRAQKLGDLLGALASASREEVAMRLRVEASRAPIRTGIRVVSGFSVGFALFLMVIARSYMSPFGTPAGELALALIGVLYAVGLTLLLRMARPQAFPRLLVSGGGIRLQGGAV